MYLILGITMDSTRGKDVLGWCSSMGSWGCFRFTFQKIHEVLMELWFKFDAGLIILVIWKVLKDQHNVLREEKLMREKNQREKSIILLCQGGKPFYNC